MVILVLANEKSQAFPDNRMTTTIAAITSARTTTARITEITKTTKITRTTTIPTTITPTEPSTTRERTTSTTWNWSEICKDKCYGEWTHCLEGCLDTEGNSNSLCESCCFTKYHECLKLCDLNWKNKYLFSILNRYFLSGLKVQLYTKYTVY